MEHRKQIIQFYSSNATLNWIDSQKNGINEISKFLSNQPQTMFKVTGYEVQTVPLAGT
jgi:hypothetical protein